MKSPESQPSKGEFVALMAMMMATNAFSVDAMLPALSEMGQTLSPENPVRSQLVVIIFMIGMGIGTFFTGPLSDAYGRRPLVIASGAVYMAGAVLAWLAPSLELILAARLIQGLGASGARVVAMAMVRDRFAGRAMAQITSLIITVFMVFPAIAPSIGQAIIWIGGWRSVFLSFVIFSGIVLTWFMLRQPETLAPENRRPIRLPLIRAALIEIVSIPMVRRTVLAMSCCFAMMLTNIASIELVFEEVLHRGAEFPLWFGAAAISSLAAPMLNSRIVMRFGMHRISTIAMTSQAALSGLYLIALQTGLVPKEMLLPYFLWLVSIFMTMGLSMGNLNAMVMEPLGHVAGIASSLIASISTILGALVAIPAAASFNGTQMPVVLCIFGFMVFGRLMLAGRAYDRMGSPA
ncbi:multidrug effflux MFS transporter [Mangrovicoccus ximenensis]|uniref:multidrug effflux MFS transporter n=1 Tax=Mangrovicoccus ximenensis TaxID=1911570 RepID=UPI001374F93F|nr:multidrug effflux MFS transporter [Mangrovicoccus ximenensis]